MASAGRSYWWSLWLRSSTWEITNFDYHGNHKWSHKGGEIIKSSNWERMRLNTVSMETRGSIQKSVCTNLIVWLAGNWFSFRGVKALGCEMKHPSDKYIKYIVCWRGAGASNSFPPSTVHASLNWWYIFILVSLLNESSFFFFFLLFSLQSETTLTEVMDGAASSPCSKHRSYEGAIMDSRRCGFYCPSSQT